MVAWFGYSHMTKKVIDKNPRIVLGKPDVAKIEMARRWLRGAARLLDDASNGDELVDRIAHEAAILANMAEIALFDENVHTGR